VEANSTGGQASHRAVVPSGDEVGIKLHLAYVEHFTKYSILKMTHV
jgi:hypothetical protein